MRYYNDIPYSSSDDDDDDDVIDDMTDDPLSSINQLIEENISMMEILDWIIYL